MKPHTFGQGLANEGGKVAQQILACGLPLGGVYARKVIFQSGYKCLCLRSVADDEGVVELGHNTPLNSPLDLLEVDSHTHLWAIGVGAIGLHRHLQEVGVAVNLVARAVVAHKGVGHFESKLFGE